MERHAAREAKCVALEQEHVHRVYEKTAHHFTDVHYKAWPRVQAFLQDLEPGSLVADVGCGNGRYLPINPSIYTLGSDRSQGLVQIARHSGLEVMVCDNLRLPYRDGCFDAVISIAVIHHFTTAKRRALALRELARVLRPGGKIMIYVWAMEQKKRKFNCQDVLVPWHFKPRLKAENPTNGHITQNGLLSDHHHQAPAANAEDSSLSSKLSMRFPWHSNKPRKPVTSSDPNGLDPTSKSNSTNPPLKPAPGPFPRFKLPFRGLFNNRKSEGPEPVTFSNLHDKTTGKIKDDVYKRLIEQIMREDQEIFKLHRPLLQHSVSAPEEDGFAVREFPLSSQPFLLKQTSLDSAKQALEHISVGSGCCQISSRAHPDKLCSNNISSATLR